MEIVPVIALILVMVFSGGEAPLSKASESATLKPAIHSQTTHKLKKPAIESSPAKNPEDYITSEFKDKIESNPANETQDTSSAINPLGFLKLNPPDYEKEKANLLRFIRKTYRKIPVQEATVIAKSLLDHGQKTGLDPKFAAALMARESSFHHKAISPTGAKGLGQIKDFNYKTLQINNPYDINQNVRGTVSYLKKMLSSWEGRSNQSSLALASYFRGINRIKRANGSIDNRAKQYANDILEKYDELVKGLDQITP